MKDYIVTFRCKPNDHWRPCSYSVTAETELCAFEAVRMRDYGMPVAGPYTVEVRK